MIVFFSGFIIGFAIGMTIIGVVSINENDRLRETVGKLQIELKYAQGVRSPRTQDGDRHDER